MAPELVVIDQEGKNLGKITKAEALALAAQNGLDLIEVSPMANPPVCRVMSFDKFRYEQGKKLKKRRAEQRGQTLKQVQISVREARNDLERKAALVNEFLSDGNQVEISLRLRGREKYNKDWARKKIAEFREMITPEHRVVTPPQFGATGLLMQVTKI